jgi:hydrogenase maturation protein HypF
MTKKRYFIKVFGIVQGVGFRPYVYNLALSLDLKGWVNNNSEGVYIDLEGDEEVLLNFLHTLETSPPPLARIENIITEENPLADFTAFTIKESERNENSITLISPDIALCSDCREDILNPDNRRYGYPFTNCTNCGPRFSIIKSIPYDRDKTTMEKFKMCPLCNDEYTDPLNRRFHAQPNACSECGPHIWVTDSHGHAVNDSHCSSNDAIDLAVEKLKTGSLFAVKGLTGFHLCCDGKNSEAVKLLRVRKRRPFKPFAVMMKDIETIKKYCKVNDTEEKLLTGIRKPIVLLNRKEDFLLPEEIAPNQNTLGVMLPYTPLHELLFSGDLEVLIMTSANYYGLPLEYVNETAVEHLSSIVDYFLMHNRDIYIPVDDSVARVVAGKERSIRRARGYAPDPLRYKDIDSILALGPNMKNTFSIGKDNFVFMSQHNGDLENIETTEHYKRNINHFMNIFSFAPKYIAHDMHPNYSSTSEAEEYNLPKIAVQHHHAHIASCMVENNLRNKVIGISFDGTGYGPDNKIWGGEFLICDLKDYDRGAHLKYIKLPGGEKAVREPWRMAVSYISSAMQKDPVACRETVAELFGEDALNLLPVIESGFNSTETSSMGRLFDAVSSILDICKISTYEGQASIELEAVIDEISEESYPYEIDTSASPNVIDPGKIIISILNDRFNNVSKGIISSKFHNTVVKFSVDACINLRNLYGINEVALSGGVFQNSYLLEKLIGSLAENDFKVYSHSSIPSNDGGISLGQIAVANEKIKFENDFK